MDNALIGDNVINVLLYVDNNLIKNAISAYIPNWINCTLVDNIDEACKQAIFEYHDIIVIDHSHGEDAIRILKKCSRYLDESAFVLIKDDYEEGVRNFDNKIETFVRKEILSSTPYMILKLIFSGVRRRRLYNENKMLINALYNKEETVLEKKILEDLMLFKEELRSINEC